MDINRKLQIVESAIKSVTLHDDLDAAVRLHALDKMAAMLEAERHAIEERVQAAIDAEMPPPKPAGGKKH